MGRQIMTEQFFLHSGIRETLELPGWRDRSCWEPEVILLSDSKARCYCCSLMWASSQPSLKHSGHPKPLLVTTGIFLFFLFWCKDSIPRGSHLEENRSSSFLLLLVLQLEGIYLLGEWKRSWHHQSHQRIWLPNQNEDGIGPFLFSQLFQTCSQSMDKGCLHSGLVFGKWPSQLFPLPPYLTSLTLAIHSIEFCILHLTRHEAWLTSGNL